jgi:DNA polymerase-3 subunit delta
MDLHDDDTGRAVSLDMVLAELKRGKTFPCYLLCGDEEFRLRNALDKITQRLIPDERDRELNLFVTDGEHEDVGSLCESLITPPLLPGRKVVVVRDTRLFQSKNVLMPLIVRIRERLDQDPGRAAADFMEFLRITGLQFDDLRDGGWRKIDDETWKRIVPDDDGQGRETWLPKAVELCVSQDAALVKERMEETDRLERIITGGMPEGNHLILTAEAVDRRKKLFKTVSTAGRVLSFTKIKGEGKLKDKARQEAVQDTAAELLAQAGKRLSASAWSALGQKTGFDLRESMGAIEKLITYAGAKSQIEAADVEAVVGRTKEDTVFQLTGALSGRNLTRALRTLHELLDHGEPPLKVFSMIIREIRCLFWAKQLLSSGQLGSFSPGMDYGRFQKMVYPTFTKLSDDSGMEGIALIPKSPFPAYQVFTNAGRFSHAELTGYLELLVQTDLALKTTGQDERLLLERFLIAVCGSR